MTDEIQPALTPKEWAEFLAHRPVFFNCVEAEYDGETVTLREEIDCLEDGAIPKELDITKREKHFVMAVLNSTMWDEDPRKITRSDTEFLSWCGNYAENPGWVTYEKASRLHVIAAKLAALLPPTNG